MVNERCRKTEYPIGKSISQLNVSNSQESCRSLFRIKFEKVESIHSIREFQNAEIVPSLGYLQKEDYMCKSNLKNAYFLVFLHQFSQNFPDFKWNNSIYQFLSFWIMASALGIHKLKLKFPFSNIGNRLCDW